jgi:SAM-dependent methyltransferase
MYVAERTLTFMRSLLKSYGPSIVKKRLWDAEFSGGKWNFIDDTRGDCVYSYLEKYARNGSILDLGCGPGNTANELTTQAYQRYVGVDISEAALQKGRKRSIENGRGEKNLFLQGDFINYEPAQQFDIILFRESMYHVPIGRIKSVLDHYSQFLVEGGVFIVRMNTKGGKLGRPKTMADLIASEFDLVERNQHGDSGATVIVVRPRSNRQPQRS